MSRLFGRREAPPVEVVARLPVGERVVSWADVRGGGVVLATPAGLWWPMEAVGHRAPAEEPAAARLIDWHRISKAVWRAGALSVVEADVVEDLLLVDRPPVALDLEKPRDLPPVVRRRVEANIVKSELLSLPGGAARFVARRVPGTDGVSWWARLEPGTRDSREVRSAVNARLVLLRAEYDALHEDL